MNQCRSSKVSLSLIFPPLTLPCCPSPLYYFIGNEKWNNFLALVTLIVWLIECDVVLVLLIILFLLYILLIVLFPQVNKELFGLKLKYSKGKYINYYFLIFVNLIFLELYFMVPDN